MSKEGAALLRQRKSGIYPPAVRKILETNGSDLVKELKVVRIPVNSAITAALNVLSAGAYSKAVRKLNYDKMYHLQLQINGEYTLEKNEVVSLTRGVKEGESLQLPDVAKPVTLKQLIDNTKQKMGASKFSRYSAFTNNCQDFILAVLDANGLLTEEATTFIKQDVESLLKMLPSSMNKITDTITDAAAAVETTIHGEGKSKQATTWKSFYASEVKGKKFGSRAEVNEAMKVAAAKYKEAKK